MPSFSLRKQIRTHLASVEFTTFHQLVDFLLSSKYTAEQYPKLGHGERRKLAKSDASDAIEAVTASGELKEAQVTSLFGDSPRAKLVYDSFRDGRVTAAHFGQAFESWSLGKPTKIKILYRPGGPWEALAALRMNDCESTSARLVAASVYFDLPTEEQASWVVADIPPLASYQSVNPTFQKLAFRGGPVYEATTAGHSIPIVTYRNDLDPDESHAFVELMNGMVHFRNQAVDRPLRIWIPDAGIDRP